MRELGLPDVGQALVRNDLCEDILWREEQEVVIFCRLAIKVTTPQPFISTWLIVCR